MAHIDVESPQFLLHCLRLAFGQCEVIYDIVDVCALCDLTALSLAKRERKDEIGERLYLTELEADDLCEICAREIAKHPVHSSRRAVLAPPPSPPPPALPTPLAPVLENAPLLRRVSRPPPLFIPMGGASTEAPIASYLRPTASSQRQTKVERLAAEAREAKPEAPKLKTGTGVFARLGQSLVAPTAAFLARMTGNKKDAENGGEQARSGKLAKSRMLEKVLDNPPGQRSTRPQAFNLAVDSRPKAVLVSTDDRQLAEAQAHLFKPNAVPRHVYQSRPLEFRAATNAKLPQEVFVPFHLASLSRHMRRMKELRMEAEAEESADQEARRFQAIRWSKDQVGVESVSTPVKPEPQAATVAKAFTFQSEARAEHYVAVIDPVKKAKEEAKEAEEHPDRVEEARKERELLEMPVSDFRRSLDFKAGRLPDFSSPFFPDVALSSSPTAPEMFALRTTARLGEARPTSARQDQQGHLGYGAAAFAQSLRGSSSGTTMISTAALRRSANNQLARSANVNPRAASSASVSPSRGSPSSPSPHYARSVTKYGGPPPRPASPASPGTGTMNMRHSLNLSLRASLRASLTQGLAQARVDRADARAAAAGGGGGGGGGSAAPVASATSRRSTRENALSPRMLAGR